MADRYNFDRFVRAQAPMYGQVVAELRAGSKRNHWMWFVFPQIAGLGMSGVAQEYAISSLDEARAYLEHEVLGQRLRECARLVLAIEKRSIHEVFGQPDDLKFRSSMTLFGRAGGEDLFRQCLAKYYGGSEDPRTLALLGLLTQR